MRAPVLLMMLDSQRQGGGEAQHDAPIVRKATQADINAFALS